MRFPAGPDEPRRRPPASGVRPFLHGSTEPRQPPTTRMADPGPPPGEHTTALRPFVITSGRVEGPDPAIGVETQVTVHPGAAPARLPPEKRAIVTLCVEPMSVAEISARLRLHLGVTRILVGDLRAAGQLDVHVLDNDFPDPETIMRVIRGLRALT
ncbi:MAG TPA: DUF742 domain-containing protein [Actinoplanes sp.]|nr:DUF742 domain-containing protein [Actinoplanes sp.]